MSVGRKFWVTTVIFAVVGFLFSGNTPLGAMIWPPAPGEAPTSGQLPFFMFLTIWSAIGFGVGVSFLLYAWPWVKRIHGESYRHALGMYLATGWLLVNWVPHENLHIHNGMDMQGLLYIEFGFHVTLIAAGMVLVWSFSHVASRLAAESGRGSRAAG